MMAFRLFTILLLGTFFPLRGDVITNLAESYTVCAYYKGKIDYLNEEDNEFEKKDENSNSRVKCYNSYCYALWQQDTSNTSILIGQGCWAHSSKPNDCERSSCQADKASPPARNTTKFCCCNNDLCNSNYTDVYVPTEEPAAANFLPEKDHSVTIILWTTLGTIFLILMVMMGALMYYFWKRAPKKCDVELCHPLPPPPADYSLNKLQLVNIIGQGKYGSVWRGAIEEQEVAVKIFPSHYRNCFFTEHEIYKVVGDHPCILKCYGGGEYARVLGHPEFALLLNIERESVQEYLKNHTLDLPTLSRMSLDIARGLAHLHSDVGKPCVTHRDLNTKNILVKHDLSCCICDLGLAIMPRSAESKALSEAGTLRYMSPEVLEGAVNLRDCESALKQTDIYALGLVLWEMGTRCSDMQITEPQPYMPPFFKETGENPTLEQMQSLVSRRKIRPLWPVSWSDTAAARLLCETAEDCWDQDAEARLTALCVVERFLDLPNMRGRVLHPMHPPVSPSPLINNNHLHDVSVDTSNGTVETLLSPTVEEVYKNSNHLALCVLPLKSYQGRNPCLERNLLSGSSENLLIDKSSKHCTSSESQNLITSEFLSYQVNNRANPIPYVQNPVHGLPKQQNTSQSGHLHNRQRKKFKWSAFKKLLQSKKTTNCKSAQDTQVKLKSKVVNGPGRNPEVITALLGQEAKRPCTLGLSLARSQEFTNQSGISQIIRNSNNMSKQRSLEQFIEVFSSTTDLSRLKDPSQRVKTPGDVPPSVRKNRGKAATNSTRFSLFDDRIMSTWGSAPDLDPPPALSNSQIKDSNSASVSSF